MNNRSKENYYRQMEETVKEEERAGHRPSLLLHACCAPCSSACLEYLRLHFDVTVYYYNPNIEEEEYRRRFAEELRLTAAMNERAGEIPGASEIAVKTAPYDPERFSAAAKGKENCPEGGERCLACYALRLGEAAKAAAGGGFDYVTTTLTISPMKRADDLNRIGRTAAAREGVKWLPSDFKKKNGYKRSVELSEEFCLYRQDYCGCVYSRENGKGKDADIIGQNQRGDGEGLSESGV